MVSGESPGRWIGPMGRALKAVASSPFVSQRIVVFTVTPTAADLRTLREVVEAGAVVPAIAQTYGSLAEVPDAIRALEAGHPRGKIVLTVSNTE